MNFSDFITHQGKRVNKEAFIHLVLISKVDGIISKEELNILHKEGRKFGLTDPEIEKLILMEKDHNYHAPYSLHEKFEHLYQIAEMILADDIIEDREKKLIKRFAVEAGFKDPKTDELINIIFEGIKNNISEEELFKEFKHSVLH
jgi:uncharacterized tellurite resistance protein B-like protein